MRIAALPPRCRAATPSERSSSNAPGHGTRRRRRRYHRSANLATIASLLLTSCAFTFDRDAGPAVPVDPAQPAANELAIPPLLEGSIKDGVTTFDLTIGPSEHTYGDDQPVPTYSYNGEPTLGPTLLWHQGQEVALDVRNQLGEVTTTHWHGADVPAIADGGPMSKIEPGQTWRAEFEVIQPAATLWYHPHLEGKTAEHVYAGAAGMIIVSDDNPLAADLPSTYGMDDIPVILQDKEFDADGNLVFEIDPDDNGDLNPELTVNGTLDPYAVLPNGPTRLRLLNGSQARVYELSTDTGPLVKIASDGGYLESPVEIDALVLAPGDRAEVIVDPSQGTTALLDTAFQRVLELRPDTTGPAAAPLPGHLGAIESYADLPVDAERTFTMTEMDGGGLNQWGINGEAMDMSMVNVTIRHGDLERWTIQSFDGVHSFHVHQTMFQIVERNGRPPAPADRGWEDTVLVEEGDKVVILARFDSYTNPEIPYMFHCHVLDHEDTGMMGQFQVLAAP